MLVIELKSALHERRDFDRKLGICRRRVRDRQHGHHPFAVLIYRHENDGTRPVLYPSSCRGVLA
jgi:hypothetical protein